MMNLFHSTLLVIAEIALGLSVLVFVGGALAAYGAKLRSKNIGRVSSFRWLPQSAKAPTPNCLDFG